MTDLFKAIHEIPTVRRIQGLEDCEGVAVVEPNLLVSVLNRLEKLQLVFNEEQARIHLTSEQLELLFTAIAEKSNLEFLEVNGQPHVNDLNPELFAAAISNVAEVVLGAFLSRDITTKQIEALFSVVIVEDRSLNKLSLTVDPRPNIDPDMMGRALSRLEDVTIHWMESVEQINAIMRNLVKGESRLNSLM